MNDIVMGVGCILGSMFSVLIGLYLVLCFICWTSDIIENKKWRYWR